MILLKLCYFSVYVRGHNLVRIVLYRMQVLLLVFIVNIVAVVVFPCVTSFL